jgi:hypothetical protein
MFIPNSPIARDIYSTEFIEKELQIANNYVKICLNFLIIKTIEQ